MWTPHDGSKSWTATRTTTTRSIRTVNARVLICADRDQPPYQDRGLRVSGHGGVWAGLKISSTSARTPNLGRGARMDGIYWKESSVKSWKQLKKTLISRWSLPPPPWSIDWTYCLTTGTSELSWSTSKPPCYLLKILGYLTQQLSYWSIG